MNDATQPETLQEQRTKRRATLVSGLGKKLLDKLTQLRRDEDGNILATSPDADPVDILLKCARGEMFVLKYQIIVKHARGPKKGEIKDEYWEEDVYFPSFAEQMKAAQLVAPYLAPKLSAQTVSVGEDTADKMAEVLKQLGQNLPD